MLRMEDGVVVGQAEVQRFQALLLERADTLTELCSFLGRTWDVKGWARGWRVRIPL